MGAGPACRPPLPAVGCGGGRARCCARSLGGVGFWGCGVCGVSRPGARALVLWFCPLLFPPRRVCVLSLLMRPRLSRAPAPALWLDALPAVSAARGGVPRCRAIPRSCDPGLPAGGRCAGARCAGALCPGCALVGRVRGSRVFHVCSLHVLSFLPSSLSLLLRHPLVSFLGSTRS